MAWFSRLALTCICGTTQHTYCQRSGCWLQEGVSYNNWTPKTCKYWHVLKRDVMSIISLHERVVQRTRSIEIKLFPSLGESTRADSCRSWVRKANKTIWSQCLDVLCLFFVGPMIMAIRCILLLTPRNCARLCEFLWYLNDVGDTKEAHKDVHNFSV